MRRNRFIRGDDRRRYEKMVMQTQIEWLVPRVYASIAASLYDTKQMEPEEIQEIFADSQARWIDSVEHGWDMLRNVEEVTGIKVSYFQQTGNIVKGEGQ